jgi:hypothetical protein
MPKKPAPKTAKPARAPRKPKAHAPAWTDVLAVTEAVVSAGETVADAVVEVAPADPKAALAAWIIEQASHGISFVRTFADAAEAAQAHADLGGAVARHAVVQDEHVLTVTVPRTPLRHLDVLGVKSALAKAGHKVK